MQKSQIMVKEYSRRNSIVREYDKAAVTMPKDITVDFISRCPSHQDARAPPDFCRVSASTTSMNCERLYLNIGIINGSVGEFVKKALTFRSLIALLVLLNRNPDNNEAGHYTAR